MDERGARRDEPEHRVVAVGLVWNRAGRLLLCRMHPARGIFPGQWGLPGGGVESGERMREALRRELREEIGVEVAAIRPAFFKDAQHEKAYPDGRRRMVYMIFLIFHCRADDEALVLNEEFVEYRWVTEGEAAALTLPDETRDTLDRIAGWPPCP